MLHVLIVSGGGFQGTALLRGLLESGDIHIHMADCYSENINKYNVHTFHHVSLIRDESAFTRDILNIIQQNSIQVVFPSSDHELLSLSKSKRKIEDIGSKVAVSDFPLLKRLRDKIECHEFCVGHRLPVLPAIDPSRSDTVFPLIGKPAQGFGGKGIVVARNSGEYEEAKLTAGATPYIWQPYIERFDEYSVDFAVGFSRQISPIVIRKRVRTAGGFAVICDSSNAPTVREVASKSAKILATHGGYGIFNVQILITENDEAFISDINPRAGTSSVFSMGVGVNLPLFMCRPAGDSKQPPGANVLIPHQTRMVRNLTERWIRKIPGDSIRGIVFDLDDTLIHQKRWILDKLTIMYQDFTDMLPDRERFFRVACQLIEEGKRSNLIDELIRHFSIKAHIRLDMIDAFRAAEPESIVVFSDVAANLARLKKMGLKLALLTDNPIRSQKQKIKQLAFAEMFDAIQFSMALNTEKPDPKVFQAVSEKMKARPENLIMVGDNLYRDAYGALDAGFALSCLIERRGTFFNFDHHICAAERASRQYDIIKIESLNELYFALAD